MSARNILTAAVAAILVTAFATSAPRARFGAGDQAPSGQELDRKVQAFLERHARGWRDMNVPEADGKILYEIIVKNGYTRALEIGTSTGHSGVWIAWALSKTGGRLITVEIDEGRHREAVANFREAGLDGLIDARLADAHEFVPGLPGPYDFVFCDADKDWYKNYFIAVLPKLSVGGSFVAHNVSSRGRRGGWGSSSFVEHVLSLPFMETTFREDSWAGISVSVKKAEK